MSHPANEENFSSHGFPLVLCEQTYGAVEQHMLTPRVKEFSFASQIACAAATQPAAFLVTENSAVPVADSIRGYYDQLGEEAPLIGTIYAKRKILGLRDHAERLRLSAILGQTDEPVYVIDEYVASGGTLKKARTLLERIGVSDVRLIKGVWYSQARRSDLDIDRVTSVHAPRMFEIGQKACQFANI